MKKIILIVDDNSTNLYVLKSLLESEGMETITAKNGKEALAKARSHPPDLIVSDILMPVMDGYTLCRHWKSDDQLKHIPFIFYTATYTEAKDEKFALSLGADLFIVKPQEPEVLINMLSKFLSAQYVVKPAQLKPLGEEMEFFRQYNEILFSKLEKKMLDLETANQQLKMLEERYRLSFENTSDVIFIVDENLNILSMSQSAEKILGYKLEEFIGKLVTDMKHIFTPASFEQAISDAMLIFKGETISAKIYEFMAKDGTIKIGEVSGSPIMRNGQVTGFVSIARDITDRRRMEDELRNSAQKYRTILEDMNDMYYELDIKGNMTFFNKALLSLTARSPEELQGMNFRDYMSSEGSEDALKIFGEIYKTGKPRLFVNEIVTKTGEVKYFESQAGLLLDENKQPIGFRGIARDITDRKKAQDERDQVLARLRKTLGTMIQAMSAAVEARDPYTSGHQRRVAALARSIAAEMNLSRDQIEGIRMAASIHDMGKISIPAEILSMPRKLSKLEFDLVKTHSQAGHDIIKDIDFPWPIANIILQHHERINGSGYPHGLRGDNILLEARILAVADVVETMASYRPYRPALGLDTALEEITRNKNILYDGEVVEACLKIFREKKYEFT
ncbi:MAG TPA: PAS domain S-box protein [Smithellaceae bacterium]|jgi:PAS domain S-box-containing protein|nr:PAS domain S-box protein [Smithellaceae bacterium]HQB92313.1 PAS domain S-box protein [Smithellaceae bacterium]